MARLSVPLATLLTGAALLTTARASAQCPAPSAPAFRTLTESVASGQAFTADWSEPANLLSGGRYLLEGSWTTGFEELVIKITVSRSAATFTTPTVAAPTTLYLRVRAVQPCGTFGPFSATLSLALAQAPAQAVFTTTGPSWVVPVGSAAPSSSVAVKNVGGTAGDVTLAASGGFFTVTPSTLTLAPGALGRVTLRAAAPVLEATGYRSGELLATTNGKSVSTPVQLAVAPPPPAGVENLTLTSSAGRVVFEAADGQAPPSQTITVTLSSALAGVYLAPRIAPGGTWLSLSTAELSAPVPGSGQLTLTLSVDRGKRTPADGVAPLRTLLRLRAAGAPDDLDHSAIVEVVDVDTPTVRAGQADNLRPRTGSSFFIPAVVKGSGQQDAFFFTDGWIRNLSSFTAPLNLWFTPDGKDGTTDPSVLLSQISLDGGQLLRVSDLLGALFRTGGTGTVEVRTPLPQSLSVRTTVESVTGGDSTSRYGSEVPVVARGTGVGTADGPLFLPGIDDDADRRANLLLSETTGSEVQVAASLYDGSGRAMGGVLRTVPPYGKVQVNRIVSAISSGLTVSGASLEIRAVSGTGKVFPLATVLDNRSNSFSVIRGRSLGGAVAQGRAPLVDEGFVMPSAARLTGAYDTQYTTTMSMVNGTAQPVTLALTYNYVDVATGIASSVTRSVSIPARGSLAKSIGDDVVANLFGITAPSYGWIKVTGGTNSIVAVAGINAAVDPNDPSKGVKTAQVDAVSLASASVMETGDDDHRFAGAEKSDAKRTNLVLVETAGQASQVLVRVYTPTGQALAERSFGVGAGQYLQINDVFGEGGVDAGDGPFQNAEVTAQVTSGSGKVIGLATVIDNVSRNPEIFVLESGGLPAPSLGF